MKKLTPEKPSGTLPLEVALLTQERSGDYIRGYDAGMQRACEIAGLRYDKLLSQSATSGYLRKQFLGFAAKHVNDIQAAIRAEMGGK